VAEKEGTRVKSSRGTQDKYEFISSWLACGRRDAREATVFHKHEVSQSNLISPQVTVNSERPV